MSGFNQAKKSTPVLRMPTCSVCGKISRSDHEHCEEFDTQRTLVRDQFAKLFEGLESMDPEEVGQTLIEFEAIRDVATMIRFLERMPDTIGMEDHARRAELYGITMSFKLHCKDPVLGAVTT
jgi:hypothetical protein